jgi:hypothetical protein
MASGSTFFLNSVWFAGIYVRGCIPKLFFVRTIMKGVRNTVEDVRFTYFIEASFVRAVGWHSDFHN